MTTTEGIGAPLVPTAEKPLKPGVYVQGPTPNSWTPMDKNEKEAFDQRYTPEVMHGAQKPQPIIKGSTKYELVYDDAGGQYVIRISDSKAHTQVNKIVYNQPAPPLPRSHGGAKALPYF